MVISLSNGGSIWSFISTTVVAMPRCTKFSTSSRPMKPAPTRTACFTPWSTRSLIRSVSCRFRKREDAGQVDAGDRWAKWCCPWCEDQLVVGFLVFPSRSEVTNTNLLGSAVDGLDRRPGSHVELEAGTQPLRRGDEQFLPFGDLAADVVRQAAVGERHIRPPLKQNDLGIFRQATGTSGCGSSTSHATDDEQFHDRNSFDWL